MAADNVIFSPFWAQLSLRLAFPALPPPEPVAESPPRRMLLNVHSIDRTFNRRATRVPRRTEQHR